MLFDKRIITKQKFRSKKIFISLFFLKKRVIIYTKPSSYFLTRMSVSYITICINDSFTGVKMIFDSRFKNA